MRSYWILGIAFAASAAAPASATTILILQNPMTMERRMVIRETPGPDRAFLCVLPPSDLGCQKLPLRRGD